MASSRRAEFLNSQLFLKKLRNLAQIFFSKNKLRLPPQSFVRVATLPNSIYEKEIHFSIRPALTPRIRVGLSVLARWSLFLAFAFALLTPPAQKGSVETAGNAPLIRSLTPAAFRKHGLHGTAPRPGKRLDYRKAIAVDGFRQCLCHRTELGPDGVTFDYATVKYNASRAEDWVARYNGPANSYDYAHCHCHRRRQAMFMSPGRASGSGTGI